MIYERALGDRIGKERDRRAKIITPLIKRNISTAEIRQILGEETLLRLKGEIDLPPNPLTQNASRLANYFLQEGAYGEDLVLWEEVSRAFKYCPCSASEKLIMEVFLLGRLQALKGNTSLLIHYEELANKVDKKWLGSRRMRDLEEIMLVRSEQIYITGYINDLGCSVDPNNEALYTVDEEGGGRWHMLSGEGNRAIESVPSFIKRAKSRAGIK